MKGFVPPPRLSLSNEPLPITRTITITEGISVKDLAEKLGVRAKDLIARLLIKGAMATVNQTLDCDLAKDMARHFGADVEIISFEDQTAKEMAAMAGTSEEAATASTVTRPPVVTYTFEDVYFDFDRYSLRPEATRVLDEAVAALRGDTTLRVEIEGHTCNIGTAEYNLALGDRRANAVKDYLVSRGIGADRLRTVSYGEERPKYDNSREETRRLNRRAAMVVNLTR